MKPTFIGVGAQKCASTWLYRILAEHPQVGMSDPKEINFFSNYFDRGYQWYERHFEECADKQAFGEISPSYFCEPSVPERIHRYAPGVRLIVSLRDPVKRALSNHHHEVRVGHIVGNDLSFDLGLANNPMYVEQGRYATHMKRWLSFFPPERILVVLMEDIDNQPLHVARQVYSFLGVDSDYQPEGLTTRYNPSYATRYRGLTRVKDNLYTQLRRSNLHWLWSLCTAIGLKNLYRTLNNMPCDEAIPRPDEHTLAELRNQFAPEIRELSRLIGRPLDNWLQS